MQAVDATTDGQPDPARRDRIIQAAFHRGLLLLPCGTAALRFCPALCITAEALAVGLGILRDVLAADPL